MAKAKVVANATPLIYLSKTAHLNLLQQLFNTVYITPEVKKEVVEKGKALSKTDVYIVEKALREGWLKVKKTSPVELQIRLQKGEETTISLAKNSKAKFLIMDEVRGRRAAELVGLKPIGTVGVLLLALKRGLLNLDTFLETLDQLVKVGFRLKQETYIYAVTTATRITKQT